MDSNECKYRYYNVKQNLINESCLFAHLVSEINDKEDAETLQQITKMLKHVSEISKQCHLQIGTFAAYLNVMHNSTKLSKNIINKN